MRICVLLESVMALLQKPKKRESQKNFEMNPIDDAVNIWKNASTAGIEKYIKGSAEHGTQFWTAGAGWYAHNLRDEQLDLINYLYHLNERIKLCQLLAKMMEEEEVSLRDAATLLANLVSDQPPKKLPKSSND